MNEECPTESGTDGATGQPGATSAGSAIRSRRRLLETLAVGGTTALSGCGLIETASPFSRRDGASTGSGQVFRAPIGDDPSKTTFLARHDLRPRSLFGWDNASIHLQRFLFETGVWPTAIWPNSDSGVRYTWIEEPIEITPTKIIVTISEDATWSDGHPITGQDIACLPLSNTIRMNRRPFYAADGRNVPTNIYNAIDGFDVADRSVTYRSSGGHFDSFWELYIRKRLGTWYGPHLIPTHLEPYTKYANAVALTARRAQRGTIDPWDRTSDDPHRQALIERYIRDIEFAEKFSTPKHVVSTGAWDLVEVRGSQAFVFEKNDHHRNAADINFDRFVLEYTPSATRMNARMKADGFDYASTHWERVGGVTPPSVVESFPDHITELRIPGGVYTGNEMEVNFDHPALGKRAVRMAIMYALDHEAIATNIHPAAAVPVTTPGGDCWDATTYVNQEWIDEALTTYHADRDRAAALMREAGYSMDGGQWRDADGDSVTLTLATPSDTPRWEPTVASQLSEFGVQTSVTTVGPVTFRSRVNNGDYPLWASRLNSLTNKAPAALIFWHAAAENQHRYGIFPDEQFETGRFSDTGVPLPHTADRFRAFSIRAPPADEPNGRLTDVHPSALSLSLRRTSREEFRRRVKLGLWLANWFLPTLPLTKKVEQHFLDTAHWEWPEATRSWAAFRSHAPRSSSGVFASGPLRANPDNPEANDSD